MFSSKVYFWWLIVLLTILFVIGLVTAYKNAPAKDPNALRSRIVDLGANDDNADAVGGGDVYGQAAARLRSGDETERVEALVIMISVDASRAQDALRGALTDVAPRVRRSALELATSYQVALGAGPVVPFLSDADPGVREAAAGFLVSRPYEASMMYPLSTPLGSSDPAVFGNALQVWTRFAGQDANSAAQALAAAFGSGDPEIVAAAVNAVNSVPAASQAPFRSHLQGVAGRMAGTPVGEQAGMLASQIP